MSKVKLTKSIVETMPANSFVWDVIVPGFGVRRQTVAPFYLLRYRFARRQRYVKIGRHGAPWTVEMARKRALELLGQIASGIDPQTEKERAELAQGETFGAIIERYLPYKQRGIKPKTFEETVRHLRSYASPLHHLPLVDINRRTIATLLGGIESAGPFTRNRARSSLSAFFAWAITEGLIELNPVAGTAKASEGNGRKRVLTDAEVAKLWATLTEGRFADIVRLLLLTGQRRNEIGNLVWGEIDLARKMIVLPPARTKNARQHELPLSRQALAIIERQPRRNATAFLFSDSVGFKDWDKGKARLDRRLGIEAWRLHDLRRTCASGMQRLGVRLEVIERCLNHISGSFRGVVGIYQRDPMIGEMREALQRWADHLSAITR